MTAQLGGGLFLDQRPHSLLGWRADIRIDRAEHASTLGNIALLSMSASLSALVHLKRGRMAGSAGLGMRWGALRFSGEGREGVISQSFWAPLLSVSAFLEVSIRVLPRLDLTFGLESDVPLKPVEAQADGVPVMAIEGLSVTGTAGIALLF
ncbi:MAG: hypothetical protein JRH20_18045 [Deltaproteobacteria bacterium]|nr:hypothetical protein [Deltaproteobacteria bacterium]